MVARIPMGLSASALLHAGILSAIILLPLLTTPSLPDALEGGMTIGTMPMPIALPPRTAPPAAVPRPRGGPTLRRAVVSFVPRAAKVEAAAPSETDVLADPLTDGTSAICLGCLSGDVGVPGGGPPGTGDPGPGGTGAADTAPLRVGSGVEAPRKLMSVAPRYPELARAAGLQGTVELECVIDPAGAVAEIHVVSGPALLRDAAVEAVRKWRYTPTRLNGVPVPIVMTVTVRFSLRRES